MALPGRRASRGRSTRRTPPPPRPPSRTKGEERSSSFALHPCARLLQFDESAESARAQPICAVLRPTRPTERLSEFCLSPGPTWRRKIIGPGGTTERLSAPSRRLVEYDASRDVLRKIGGGGGNRTRVRKHSVWLHYMLSPCFSSSGGRPRATCPRNIPEWVSSGAVGAPRRTSRLFWQV